ncbi:MAG: D-aminoacylase [Chloroflexota bacterium]
MFDVIIANGSMVDGSGAAARRADVGVVNGRIAALGDLRGREAARTIDATGKVVCPGFIDNHQHSDFTPLVNRACESAVRQGITTVVIGNCGHGCAPLFDPDYIRMVVVGYRPEWGVPLDWRTYDEYLDRLRTPGLAVNVMPLVAHGAIRLAVMGLAARAATSDELAQMQKLIAAAMEAGARGLSTGLEYSPGRHADQFELTALCREVARYNGMYASHIRNRGFTFIEATDEAIAIAEDNGIPCQLSHFAPRPYAPREVFPQAMERVLQARERGMTVHVDTFPDIWGPGPVAALLPPHVYEGRPAEGLARLSDAEIRDAIREAFAQPTNYLLKVDGLKGLVLTYAPRNPQLVGQSMQAIANLRGQEAYEAICDLLVAEGEDFYTILLRHIYAADEDLRTLMRSPLCAMESDGAITAPYGPLADFCMNSASYGYTARVLGKYVRDESFYTLEDAIRRMTALPAAAMGMSDRGLLRAGLAADIVVFDPQTVRDNTTDLQPARYPDGIEHVLVNGVVTLSAKGHSGALNGQLI